MTKIIPIRDLRDTSKISNMVKEENEPIYVTKNGYSDMVIMSADLYEKNYELSDMLRKLNEAEEQFAAGEFLTAEESLKRLKMIVASSDTSLKEEDDSDV